MKKFYVYFSLFSIHVLLILVAFIHFRLHPEKYIFCNNGDGLKNIFTLITYVKQPITSEGLFKYNTFFYPFGDYVFYTDNVPLFSIPFRWFCHHVYDCSAQVIPIFYMIIFLNIVLSGLLIYYILRYVAGNHLISYMMAVVLPWANPMTLRIWIGHHAFSYTSLILIAICLMIAWHRNRGNERKQWYILGVMCLLCFLSFLAQGYYLAIIALFQFFMFLFYGIYYRRERAGRFTLIMSGLYVVVCIAAATVLVLCTDKYFPLRRENAGGYDWMEMKTRFSALFSHYSFQQVYFPISLIGDDDAERAAYLGNVGLYAVALIVIVALFQKTARKKIADIQRDFFRDPLKMAIMAGSVALLSVSFGENYYTTRDPSTYYHIVNVLNPFFYLHQFTKRVEQFRALERFMWPFYFAFNIWVVYTLVQLWRHCQQSVRIVIVLGVVFFGGAEVMDYVNELQSKAGAENLLAEQYVAKAKPAHIEFGKYQAILPIPVYFVGSEEYSLIVDDIEKWSLYSYQLALASNLPLMASKMSRTPPSYTRLLLDFVAKDSLPDDLNRRLNDKPILVALNKPLARAQSASDETARNKCADYIRGANLFVERNHLQAVDSLGEVIFYEWRKPGK